MRSTWHCLIALLLISSALQAEDLDEVIQVRGQRAQFLDRFSKSQVVINRKDIEAVNAPSLLEYLRAIPGIHIVRTGARGSQSSIYLRGARSGDVLVLVDGIPVRDSTQVEGGLQLDHMGVEAVERIEISKGPLALAYGSDGLAGVINIITSQTKTGGRFLVEAGTESFSRLGASYRSDLSETMGFGLAGEVLKDEGQSDAREENGNPEKDPYERMLGKGSFSYSSGNLQALLIAESGDSRKDLDAYDTNFVFRDDSNYYGESAWQSARTRLVYSKGPWSSSLNMGIWTTERKYQNQVDGDLTGTVDAKYIGESSFAEWDLYRDFGAFDLTFGLQHRGEKGDTNSDFSGFTSLIDEKQETLGVFLVANYEDESGLGISLGGRSDQYESYGDQTNYSAELSYAWGRQVLRFQNGTGFKAPTLYQMFSSSGNRNLEAEKSLGSELIYALTLDAFSFKTSLYDRIIEDQILYDETTFQYTTVEGKAKIQGNELEMAYQPAEGHEISLWQSSLKYDDKDKAAFRGPKLSRSLAYRGYVQSHSLHLQALWVGEQNISSTKIDESTNLLATYQWSQSEAVRWFLRGENLMNQKIEQNPNYGLVHRRFFGGLRWSL